jgi:hypothetical protein
MKKNVCVLPFYKQKKTNQCVNYLVCYNFITSDKTICDECYALFGSWRGTDEHLTITDDDIVDCPLCHNPGKKICVKRPRCKHYLCVDCFRKLYFGYELDEPVFPFKNKETDFWFKYNNGIDEEWMTDKSVQQYLTDTENWNNWKKAFVDFSFNSTCFECFPYMYEKSYPI